VRTHCLYLFIRCRQLPALLHNYGTTYRHSTRVALQSQYAIPCSISLPTVQHAFYPYCTSGLTSHSSLLIVLRLRVLRLKRMVEEISKTVTQYEERLRRCSYALRLSYGRRMVAEDGGPNAMFFTVLFCDEPMALQFLKDIGLLRSKVQCNTDHVQVRLGLVFFLMT